ncbi:MAG: aminodeoxychorismate synthase component I [Alistipes sp.]|nr:aminodeoxychorismate synthase component I [Alistipes sp.]
MKQLFPTISREELRERMNTMGRSGTPFIWGIDFEGRHGFIRDDPSNCRDILWEIHGKGNIMHKSESAPIPDISVARQVAYADYETMFDTVMKGLMHGDSFLTNLTMRTEVECGSSLKELFVAAKAPYKILIGDEFVCFSPEPFVRISGGRISTFPIKGTIDASVDDAESVLLNDYKELCEHYTIVDLMRNDLNSIAENVAVERFRYVERISAADRTILQTSSEISGVLPQGREYDFGDTILPLLPAGSITGAPKQATVQLIRNAEESPRGWYTGVFGLFEGKTMDTAVMIRCIQRADDGALYFHSGGGITVNSRCEEEYREALTKVCLPL